MRLATKDVTEAAEQSVQPRATARPNGITGILRYLAAGSYRVAPWWSPQRDRDLDAYWKDSDHLSSVLGLLAAKVITVPVRVLPRDTRLKRNTEDAERFNILLNEEAEFGQGWPTLLSKWLLDYWCLAGPSKIHLGGARFGKRKSIAQMVKDKDPGPVLSVDENGNIVERKVIAWYKNPLGDRQWWWISLKNASIHSGYDLGGLFLTEDHPVMTKDGWLPAREIMPGMLVATGDPKPNSLQEQFLVGTLLGDGSMSRIPKRALLRFSHGKKQEEWLDLKLSALKGFGWTGRSERVTQFNGRCNSSLGIKLNSLSSAGLNYLHTAFYPSGKKVVPRELVEKNFSPLMLATWYLDDGNFHEVRTTIGNMVPTMHIYTNGFTVEDVQWLCELLEKHGIQSKIQMDKSETPGKEYPVICIGAEGARKIVKMIAPYVPPSMRYKLPSDSQEFDPSLWNLGNAETFYDEVLVSTQRDYHAGYGVCKTTYNLGIEGTETYIAAQMSVHNCTDNGAFMEIIGPGDPLGPIEGQATGIAHLDSHRIQRTGDREYPALYTRPDGQVIKIHHTRISMSSDNPSAREEMYGVGFCALSRAIHSGQTLMDLATYKEEKLGSRPKRGILTGKGISTNAILDSLAIADEQMDNRALSIYSQMAVLGDLPPDAALDLLDLISLPDGFDEETSMRLGMFTIATSFGVPIRWIWPASVSGATKADAMYQHIAGLGGGIGRILTTLTLALGGDPNGPYHSIGKFLPPNLYARFDLIDDEQDEQHAKIQNTRAGILKTQLETGVYDMRTAREYAFNNGDLTQAQFDRLELEDGRLPDGAPVLSLFQVDNEPFLSWLDLGVQNPLATSSNDAMHMLEEIDIAAITVQDVIANSTNVSTKARAEQALSALNALKGLYAPLAQQSVQTELMAQFGVPPEGEEPAPVEEPGAAAVEATTEQAAKAFDYGVNAGGIIAGQLARGAGGRFINAAELKSQMAQMMLARMGKGVGQMAKNSAADKRGTNRAKVAEALGLDLDSLAGMIGGETSLEQERALAARGLAEINPDGSISMSPAGRKVLAAANSGDIDAAEAALAKAGQAKQKADRQAAQAKPKAEKPTPEQRQAERAAAQEKAKAENRQRVAEQLGGRLPQDQFDALIGFADGNEPGAEQAQALAQKGLVEFDADGNPRMTAAGSRALRAANAGDVRAAKDALSAGIEKVRQVAGRAVQADATAAQYEANGQQSAVDGEARATEYQQAAAKLRTEAATATTPYTERATQLDGQAAQLDGQAAQLDARAMQADIEADVVARELATATLERRDALQKQINALRVTAEKARAEADRKRADAGNMRGMSLELQEKGRTVRKALEEKARAYDKASERARIEAAEIAEQWTERAKQMREQAEKLKASIGGAGTTATKGLRGWFKQRPKWHAVPTKKEVAAALIAWDGDPDIAPEAKGILRAKKVENSGR